MYPRPLCFIDCLIDLRAASYEVLDASFDVKWMSSRFREAVLLWLEIYAKIADPTSRSLLYI